MAEISKISDKIRSRSNELEPRAGVEIKKPERGAELESKRRLNDEPR